MTTISLWPTVESQFYHPTNSQRIVGESCLEQAAQAFETCSRRVTSSNQRTRKWWGESKIIDKNGYPILGQYVTGLIAVFPECIFWGSSFKNWGGRRVTIRTHHELHELRGGQRT